MANNTSFAEDINVVVGFLENNFDNEEVINKLTEEDLTTNMVRALYFTKFRILLLS